MLCPMHRLGLSLGIALGLAVATAAPVAAGDKEFAVVMEAFAKRDGAALNRLSDDDYKKLIVPLNQAQLNQVALLAGANLEIDSVLKGAKFDKFFDFINLKGNDKIREHWGINWASIKLLRRLSDERRLSDSAVLPYLIEALKHPDTSLVRSYAYLCLRELTYRDVGVEVFARAIDDPKKAAPLLEWWQGWWQKNKGKQLIIDVEFEKKLKKRALDTMQQIFAGLAEKYPDDLMKAHMPERVHFPGGQLPCVDYTPRRMAYIAGTGPKFKKLDELPALKVGWFFLTCGPDTAKEKPFAEGKSKVVYEEVLANTDVVFRVLLDTPDPKLEKEMIQLLKKDKGKR